MILVTAMGLLLPFAKWGIPRRPSNVPATAAFANGGKGSIYWIDCRNLAASPGYSCSVYQAKSGEILLKGVFQQSALAQQRRVFYDGSAIHWKHGQVLRPVKLECVAGGKPPSMPDRRASVNPANR